jgi:hypothetical protein
MAVLMTPPYLQFFDSNGAVLAGGKVYTYTATGTFSTNKATFTTSVGDVEHPNPVILDAAGRPDTGNGSIWLSGTYDFVVKTSADVTVETTLNVTSFTALPAASNAYFESFSGTGSQTAFTTSDDLGSDEKAIYVWVDSGLQESVTNGDFATDTGWTKGTGWTIGSGVATAAGAISVAISQTSAVTIVEGQAYSVTMTTTRSAGGLIPSVGGTDGTERTTAGTFTEVIIAGSTETLAFTGNSFTGTLDNVSITVATTAGFNIQDPSLYTISGTTLTFTTAPALGTNNVYVSAPSLLVGAASSSAADAAVSAAAALTSETQAGAYAGQLTIVSTTSLAIGTGSKVFTVAADLALSAGQFILIASDAAPTVDYMWGTIASYSSTTLTVTVAAIGGSGTLADWTMYLTGERGATGATGSISDLSGVASGTITTSDKVIFEDVDDSSATKSSTVSALLALGAGWTIIETQTASTSATIDFTSSIDSTYAVYKIVISGLLPATDTAVLHCRTGNGGSFDSGAGAYDWNLVYSHATTTLAAVGSTSDTEIELGLGVGNATTESYNGEVTLFSPSDSAKYTALGFKSTSQSDNATEGVWTFSGSGLRVEAAIVDRIQFLMSSGNIISGRFTLYGISHS